MEYCSFFLKIVISMQIYLKIFVLFCSIVNDNFGFEFVQLKNCNYFIR